jgi:hypothetical protein
MISSFHPEKSAAAKAAGPSSGNPEAARAVFGCTSPAHIPLVKEGV